MATIREMFDKIVFLKDNKIKLIVNDRYVLTFKDSPFGSGYMISNFEKENSCNRYCAWADVNVYDINDPNKNISIASLYLNDDMDIIDDNGLTAKSMSLVFKLEFSAEDKTITETKQIINVVKCEVFTDAH